MVHYYEIDGLTVRTGDIICTTDGDDSTIAGQFWRLLGKLLPGPVDHVIVYIGPAGRCVESGPKGVNVLEIRDNTWDARALTGQRGPLLDTLYGVVDPLAGRGLSEAAEAVIREDVASYCLAQAAADKPYNINFLDSKTESAFYCTQLAYLAYLRHGIDLNTGQSVLGLADSDTIIFPQEIWEGARQRRDRVRVEEPGCSRSVP